MLAHDRSQLDAPNSSHCPAPRLRQAIASDIETLIDLERFCVVSARSSARVATRTRLQRLLRAFPQGQIVVERSGLVLGSVASLIVRAGDDESGIRNSEAFVTDDSVLDHDPDGNTLYCIETCLHPSVEDERLRQMLCEGRREVCRWLNLSRILVVAPTSGYASHAPSLSREAYLSQVSEGHLEDGAITLELREGFVIQGLARPSAGGLPGSEFAALIEWHNPDYHPPIAKLPVRSRSGVMQRPAAAAGSARR